MEHGNVIELNGKRYDAVTGKYLGKSCAKPVPALPRASGGTIDDVRRPSVRSAGEKPAHSQAGHASHHAPAKKPVRRHAPHQTHPHKPQHAKTLMRHVVKKPDAKLKPNIKPQGAAEVAAAPASQLAHKRSATQVDPMRLHRARSTVRHSQVQRFGRSAAVIPARPEQTRSPAVHAGRTAAPSRHHDIFESALARAKSHEQITPRLARQHHRRKRTTRVLVGIAVFLAVGLIFAWLQRPQIELHLASFQAGFDASMPGYNLTDYERGSIRQEHSQVVMDYRSGDRYYRITQQASDWNSQTLLDSAVKGASTGDSQVLESKGRLIYLIEGNGASWVDGGVRYEITGNAPLTRGDILKIAESM